MKNKIPFINPLPETNLAINAVIEAGIAVTKIYNEGFETKFKANNEPITDADIESNKIIHKITPVRISDGIMYLVFLLRTK